MTNRERERPAQEEDAIPGRSTLLWMGGTVLATVLLAGVAWGILRAFTARPPGVESARTGRAPSAGAAGAGVQLRDPFTRRPDPTGPDSATRARLERYRWIDRGRGVLSVPVGVAMELMVRTDGRAAPRGERQTPDAAADSLGRDEGEGGRE